MPLFPWSQKYSVGIAAMDKQHRELVSLLNQIHKAILSGHSDGVTWEMLDRLALYTVRHFEAEEQLMSSVDYPEYTSHCQAHRKLTDRVEHFIATREAGNSVHNFEMAEFLANWLNSHILGADKLYGEWILLRQVKDADLSEVDEDSKLCSATTPA